MGFTIGQISDALSARSEGNDSLLMEAVSEPSVARPTDLALAMDKSYEDALRRGAAKAAVLWDGADYADLGLEAAIFIERPRYAMAALTSVFEKPPATQPGIHPTAIVDPAASIGDGASIGAFCIVGEGVKVGKNARILSHTTIGDGAPTSTSSPITTDPSELIRVNS